MVVGVSGGVAGLASVGGAAATADGIAGGNVDGAAVGYPVGAQLL